MQITGRQSGFGQRVGNTTLNRRARSVALQSSAPSASVDRTDLALESIAWQSKMPRVIATASEVARHEVAPTPEVPMMSAADTSQDLIGCAMDCANGGPLGIGRPPNELKAGNAEDLL